MQFKQRRKLCDVKLVCKISFRHIYVEDAPCSGSPIEADEGKIKAVIDANPRITTGKIA